MAELRDHGGLNKYKKPHWAACSELQYLMNCTGFVATNVVVGGLFWYPGDDCSTPDLQFHFLAVAGAESGVGSVSKGISGVTLNYYGLRPKSRGTVRLSSGNAKDVPKIEPNDIADPDGHAVTNPDLAEFVRNHVRTSYHPAGTCRMGSDESAVVDTNLKPKGFDGIRIRDSSIFPSLVGSNTNAPTVMVAEKASDMILGRNA